MIPKVASPVTRIRQRLEQGEQENTAPETKHASRCTIQWAGGSGRLGRGTRRRLDKCPCKEKLQRQGGEIGRKDEPATVHGSEWHRKNSPPGVDRYVLVSLTHQEEVSRPEGTIKKKEKGLSSFQGLPRATAPVQPPIVAMLSAE